MDIEGFYRADERRRRSEEVEFGTDWHDSAKARYEVSWVADTGELYLMGEPNEPFRVDLFGDMFELAVPTEAVTVAVIGWVADRSRLEQILDGWPAAMAGPDSLSWLAERLRQQAVPKQPPAPGPPPAQ
jgi:hypothetical protein